MTMGHAASTCASGQPRGYRRCIRRDDHRNAPPPLSGFFPSPLLFAEYGRIAGLAAGNRFADDIRREGREWMPGGLMSYGANLPDLVQENSTVPWIKFSKGGPRPAGLARAATDQGSNW